MESSNKFITILSKWWFVLAFAVSMIVMWTNLQGQVVTNTKDIASLRSEYIEVTSNQTQIQVQLSQIQTDILWIKNTLSRSTVVITK